MTLVAPTVLSDRPALPIFCIIVIVLLVVLVFSLILVATMVVFGPFLPSVMLSRSA